MEALEYMEDGQFILGVQWHPEMMASCGNEEQLGHFQGTCKKKYPVGREAVKDDRDLYQCEGGHYG